MVEFPILRGSVRIQVIVSLILLTAVIAILEFNSVSYLPSFVLQKTPNKYTKSPSFVESYFTPPDPQRQDYHEWNAQTLRDLHTCMAKGNCGDNQLKVVLLAAHWFQEAVVQGFRGGEGVWAVSVYENLHSLGYTTLFAIDFPEALAQYRMMPDLVKVVIRNKAGECHSDPTCVKGPSNPTGIPAWKIFDFEYFPSPGTHYHASLMGGMWILSADIPVHPARPIQYIGYSMEKTCNTTSVIPLSECKNRAWLLMKQLTYVYDKQFAWNRSYFSLAWKDLGLSFTGGWRIDQHYQWDPETQGELVDIEDRDHGVVNLGALDSEGFAKELGDSKVFVGVGNPWWSPSPYYALCHGIPFVNPILNWNEDQPWDRTYWYSQHPTLALQDPPYVYNVHADDYDGFVKALREASSTEIGRHIFPHMTDAALQERLIKLVETDWRTQAAALLEERLKEGHDSYVFEL